MAKSGKLNPHSMYWRNKADAAWKKIVKIDSYCEWCMAEKKQLHAHHLIDKDMVFFRHNLNNGVCLCASCHKFSLLHSAHRAPWVFEAWLQWIRPEQFIWFTKNRLTDMVGVKVNYKQVYEQLLEHPDA